MKSRDFLKPNFTLSPQPPHSQSPSVGKLFSISTVRLNLPSLLPAQFVSIFARKSKKLSLLDRMIEK